MLRIGVIGLGYWGPNLLRCLSELRECEVVFACDRDEKRLEAMAARFPSVIPTKNADEVIHGGRVDAVIIATPTRTHHALASQALAAGLHVFVEKPLAASTAECRELIELAEHHERVLFVGHIFLHSSPVAKLRELVNSGDLGDLYYISSKRLNLGPVRNDCNALWDLAPHDISVMLDLLGGSPLGVSCSGSSYLKPHVHDVCNMTMYFPEDKLGLTHVSWLDPRKDRVMTIVGSKKMVVYDDLEPLEKIKIYDRGVDSAPYAATFGEFQYSYRYGDTHCPHLEQVEPLRAECSDFINAIVNSTRPRTDGLNGLQVVEVLEAATESLRLGGVCVSVGSPQWQTNAAPAPTNGHVINGAPTEEVKS